MKTLFNTIINFINKETVEDNESKKMTVLVRGISVLLMFFFVTCFLMSLFGKIRYGTAFNLFFIALFGIVLCISYYCKKAVTVWAFLICAVIWMTLSLLEYGEKR